MNLEVLAGASAGLHPGDAHCGPGMAYTGRWPGSPAAGANRASSLGPAAASWARQQLRKHAQRQRCVWPQKPGWDVTHPNSCPRYVGLAQACLLWAASSPSPSPALQALWAPEFLGGPALPLTGHDLVQVAMGRRWGGVPGHGRALSPAVCKTHGPPRELLTRGRGPGQLLSPGVIPPGTTPRSSRGREAFTGH